MKNLRAGLLAFLLVTLAPTQAFTQSSLYPFFGDGHWRSPVNTVGALPTSGNFNGDTRIVLSPIGVYEWNGSSWSSVTTSQMAANSIKGNNTGSTANASDLTGTQVTAMLDTFTSSLKGLVPSSGGGTTSFLRADGTFSGPYGVIPVTLVDTVTTSLPATTGTASVNLYTTFSSSTADYAAGSGTGTLTGATISGGLLDCTGNAHKYIDFAAGANLPGNQIGAVRIKVKPNYTGFPSDYETFFAINSGAGVTSNLIALQHRTGEGGAIIPYIYNNSSGVLNSTSIGVFNPTAGQTYELELNYNLNTGDVYLFVDGALLGHLTGVIGTRNAANGIRVGSDASSSFTSNFSVDEFETFPAMQHTSNYTAPSGAPSLGFSSDGILPGNGDIVLFTNLSSGNNKAYQASLSGSNYTWTLVPIGHDASGAPSEGDVTYVKSGVVRRNRMFAFNTGSWIQVGI